MSGCLIQTNNVMIRKLFIEGNVEYDKWLKYI